MFAVCSMQFNNIFYNELKKKKKKLHGHYMFVSFKETICNYVSGRTSQKLCVAVKHIRAR